MISILISNFSSANSGRASPPHFWQRQTLGKCSVKTAFSLSFNYGHTVWDGFALSKVFTTALCSTSLDGWSEEGGRPSHSILRLA